MAERLRILRSVQNGVSRSEVAWAIATVCAHKLYHDAPRDGMSIWPLEPQEPNAAREPKAIGALVDAALARFGRALQGDEACSVDLGPARGRSMWLFAAVSVAIATPCFRAWLEALFAELTIVFFNYLRFWAAVLSAILVLALVFHGRRFLRSRRLAGKRRPTVNMATVCRKGSADVCSEKTDATTAGLGLPRVQWKRRGGRRRALFLHVKSTTSEIAGSGFYPPQLWTSALFALAMLPIINSVVVGGGGKLATTSSAAANSDLRLRGLKTDVAAVGEAAQYAAATFTADEDSVALETLNAQLTTCKYSGGDSCLDDVTQISVLGDYQQATGYCVAFDAAYVNVTTPGAALPSQYFPIGVADAYDQGFANNFSAWSIQNQEKFQVDCPMLYDDTIVGNGDELLCCTETQYEALSLQVRALPGQCSSCKQNLRNLWCQSTCHPSNSLFLDVTQVRLVDGDAEHAMEVFPTIEEATYYVGTDLARDLHDYCAGDSAFTSLVCGAEGESENCSATEQQVLRYLGAYSFNSEGSPSQFNFTTTEQLLEDEQEDQICVCGDDSSDANTTNCILPMDTRLESCVDTCGAMCDVSENDERVYHSACYSNSSSFSSDSGYGPGVVSIGSTESATVTSEDGDVSVGSENSSTTAESKVAELLIKLSSEMQGKSLAVLNYLLAVLAFFAATALALGWAYSTHYGKKKKRRLDSLVEGQGPLGTVGPGALSLVNLDQLKCLGKGDHWLTTQLKRWGDFVATGNHPYYIILLALLAVVCCSSGLIRLKIETDPMKLWAFKSSTAFQESTHFGEILGPVERSERLVLVTKDGGAVTRSAYLREAIRLQELVANDIYAVTNNDSTSERVTLSDVCLKDASDASCRVNAVTQYFQNSLVHFDVYKEFDLETQHLTNCARDPLRADTQVCSELQAQLEASGDALPPTMADCPCVSAFGAPMEGLEAYLGGFAAQDSTTVSVSTYLEEATALFSTALVVNYQEDERNADAIKWERAFVSRMQTEVSKSELFDVYYSAEISASDVFEAATSLHTVFRTAIVGFVFMAVFVALGLTRWKMDRHFFQSSKLGVGLLGVACILMAVTATMGLFAWIGVKQQVVTIVLLPLLTLAIGTGNIFLIMNAVALKQEELRLEQRSLFVGLEDNDFGIHEITCVLLCESSGHIAPSMTLTAACECVVIVLATYSSMPAAQWLAVFLTVGVAASFALQMTLFLAVVALDKRRELGGKYDLLCCKRASFAHRPRLSEDENTGSTENSSFPGSVFSTPSLNLVDRAVAAYVRLLARKSVKVAVLFVFAACTLLAVVSLEKLERGLPLTTFMPTDSYLHEYTQAVAVNDASAKNSPLYLVVEADYDGNPGNFNSVAADASVQAKLCRSKELCDELSIPNLLETLLSAGDANVTFLKTGGTLDSWLDDFWGFVAPDSECCRVDADANLTYVSIPGGGNRSELTRERSQVALPCLAHESDVLTLPQTSFMSLFSMFSTAAAGPLCSYGAGARYHGQLSVDSQPLPAMTSSAVHRVRLNGSGYGDDVTAFAYKLVSTTAHASTSSGQEAAITAYAQARRIAEWLSAETGVAVWAYSPQYVLLEQFDAVRRDAYVVVGVALVAVLALQRLALGSWWYASAVAFLAFVTVLQVAGLMRVVGVPLNALAVVNLAVAVGFSVEFSGHFARLFAKARSVSDTSGCMPAGDACVKKALQQLLASSTLGVAAPKLLAPATLALASASVFRPTGCCFFRMLLGAALLAWLDGVLLLPVGLSICADAGQGRVRDVKATTEEGNEYTRESPTAWYRDSSGSKY